MGCKRISPTPKWAAAWHRLRCTDCRAAARADEKIARGVAMLRGEQPPTDGLAKTLSVLAGMPMPVEEFKPASAQAWKKGLALAGAMGVVAVLVAGYKLNNRIPQIAVMGTDQVGQGTTVSSPAPSNNVTASKGTKQPHGNGLRLVTPPKPPLLAKNDAKEARPRVHRPNHHRPVRIPQPESRIAQNIPATKTLASIDPLASGKSLLSEAIAPPRTDVMDLVAEQKHDARASVVAAYGVDGDRQVRLSLDSRVLATRRAEEGQPVAARLYVIDRLTLTPHEPKVASNPERAKESQVW